MPTPTSPVQQALLGLRVVVATLLFIHGTSRAATGGVTGFGGYLNSMHITSWPGRGLVRHPDGDRGAVTLAAGRLIRPLALYFAAELTLGIIMVHAKEGWFVVGGGRNWNGIQRVAQRTARYRVGHATCHIGGVTNWMTFGQPIPVR